MLFRLSLLSLALCFSGTAFADGGPQNRTFGLGLQLGSPLGITGKAFFTPRVALAFGVGSILPYGGLGTWVDLDFHFVHFHTRKDRVLLMSLYAGPGLQAGWAYNYYCNSLTGRCYGATYVPGYGYNVASGPVEITVHGLIGFAVHWQRLPFDTYVELTPGITFIPVQYGGAFFSFGAAVGGRYYF